MIVVLKNTGELRKIDCYDCYCHHGEISSVGGERLTLRFGSDIILFSSVLSSLEVGHLVLPRGQAVSGSCGCS